MQRKMATFLAAGFISYATYAYIARVCTPMIQRTRSAKGSRTQGIVFLAFFSILFCIMAWSYATLLSTGPGYLRDMSEKTMSPEPPSEQDMMEASNGTALAYNQQQADTAVRQEEERLESNAAAGTFGPGVGSAVAHTTSTSNGHHADQGKEPWNLPQRQPSSIPVLLPYYRVRSDAGYSCNK